MGDAEHRRVGCNPKGGMSRETQEAGLPTGDPRSAQINAPHPDPTQLRDEPQRPNPPKGMRHNFQARPNEPPFVPADQHATTPGLAPLPGRKQGELLSPQQQEQATTIPQGKEPNWQELKRLNAESVDLQKSNRLTRAEADRLSAEAEKHAQGRKDVIDNFRKELDQRVIPDKR
jgi:hypothetical protein